jgi:SAM-dependent methyltransferase
VDPTISPGNLGRFSGFGDLYDAHRPSPPGLLGPLLASYARVPKPAVVDLGSGTGLSSRWAAEWAGSVIGIEPNDDMRAVAESRPSPTVQYRAGVAQATGVPDGSADVVLAVQAMHWMDPRPTLAEVARILRPGGVFAVVDTDWPPIAGSADAEHAWAVLHRRIRVFEARAARGDDELALRAQVADDDPALADEDLRDPHRNRAMPQGVQSWSKSEHLSRMAASGHFAFTREVVLDGTGAGGPERFVALMRSQGSYQGLRRLGLSDDEIGMTEFEHRVRDAIAGPDAPAELVFSWRVRLGVTPDAAPDAAPGPPERLRRRP